MSRCINNGMTSLTSFLVTNPMGKKMIITARVNTLLTFLTCPRKFMFVKKNVSKESSVEVMDEREQGVTRNALVDKLENEEDSIGEAFHTEFKAG